MCGLVGIVTDRMTVEKKRAIRLLLKLDELRGIHSTGLGMVNKDGDYGFIKKKGPSSVLLDTYSGTATTSTLESDGDVRGLDWHYLMGHNRHATLGSINDENAHPFGFDRILGCHNGTLRMQTMTKFADYTREDLDSRLLFHELNERGGVMDDIYSEVSGAMALTWYDVVDKKVRILRNEERTLFHTWSQDKKTMVYASEPWMIQAVAQRLPGVFSPPATRKDYNFRVSPFQPHILHEIDLVDPHQDAVLVRELKPNNTVFYPGVWPEYRERKASPHVPVGKRKPRNKWRERIMKGPEGQEIRYVVAKTVEDLPHYSDFMECPDLDYAFVKKDKTKWYPSVFLPGWSRHAQPGWTAERRQSIRIAQQENQDEEDEQDDSWVTIFKEIGPMPMAGAQEELNRMSCVNCGTSGRMFNFGDSGDMDEMHFLAKETASLFDEHSRFCCSQECAWDVMAIVAESGRDPNQISTDLVYQANYVMPER